MDVEGVDHLFDLWGRSFHERNLIWKQRHWKHAPNDENPSPSKWPPSHASNRPTRRPFPVFGQVAIAPRGMQRGRVLLLCVRGSMASGGKIAARPEDDGKSHLKVCDSMTTSFSDQSCLTRGAFDITQDLVCQATAVRLRPCKTLWTPQMKRLELSPEMLRWSAGDGPWSHFSLTCGRRTCGLWVCHIDLPFAGFRCQSDPR